MPTKGFLTRVAVTATIVVVLYGGTAAAAGRHGPRQSPTPPGVFGTVSAITQGASGNCGTAGADGTFTVDTWKSTTSWTVTVTGTTTFVEPGVTTPPPSFANVCVGQYVGALGTVDQSTDTVTATQVFITPLVTRPTPRGVFGTVTAITQGATGNCGTAGADGTFTVDTWKSTTSWTVTVTGTTTFVEPGVTNPPPSFANVCVGSVVGALGTVDQSTDTVTATQVFISPQVFVSPPPAGVFGQVASVDGVNVTDTCGNTSELPSEFTLTTYRGSTTWTVDVTSSTLFVAPGVSMPSFDNVCVGEWVGALGTVDVSTSTVNPTTKVLVAPLVSPPPPSGVFGTVSAITEGATGNCGTPGSSGSFTVETWQNTTSWTVTVTGNTTYTDPGVTSASFGNVCVGDVVAVSGTPDSSTDTVAASHVSLARSISWGHKGFSVGRPLSR